MNNRTTAAAGGPGKKWVLPAILAVLIIAIVAIAYFATHPHVFGSSKTATPTPTATTTPRPSPTATHTPGPTATPRPGPTGTPRPGPTGTPRPAPTATPKPAPSSTPNSSTASVQLGPVSYPPSQLQKAQQQATAGNPSYTYYLNPYKVIKTDLPKHGFNAGAITIVSPPPPPQPTPTPYTNSKGLPETKIKVQYQGKTYLITLDQPENKGAGGIWVIVNIAAA